MPGMRWPSLAPIWSVENLRILPLSQAMPAEAITRLDLAHKESPRCRGLPVLRHLTGDGDQDAGRMA